LADRKALAADFGIWDEHEEVGAAAHRLTIGIHVRNSDLPLGERPGLADHIADAIEVIALTDLRGVGRGGEEEGNSQPSVIALELLGQAGRLWC
jgi:hypothetical protein